MKKKITFLFAMLAGLVTTAMAGNVISADPLTITETGTAKLTINLTNTDVVRGVQFTLTLPEGVTVEGSDVAISYGDGNQTYTPTNGLLVLTTDRTTNWWALGNKVGDNYKFVLLDPNGGGMQAGEGAIMKITFKAAAGAASGDVTISDIHMSIAGSTQDATQADVTMEDGVTVSDPIKGDVNDDGDIFTDDAVCILRYVVGKANTVFIESAADVNNDNEIDTQDAVLILKYVVGKITSFSRGEVDNDVIDWDDVRDPD